MHRQGPVACSPVQAEYQLYTHDDLLLVKYNLMHLLIYSTL